MCANVYSTAGPQMHSDMQSTDYYETRYIDVDPTPYSVTERSALEKTQAM